MVIFLIVKEMLKICYWGSQYGLETEEVKSALYSYVFGTYKYPNFILFVLSIILVFLLICLWLNPIGVMEYLDGEVMG